MSTSPTYEQLEQKVEALEKYLEFRRPGEMSLGSGNGKSIFRAIGHPVFLLDSKHTILMTNPATEKLAGLSQEELRGKKCYRILHGSETSPDRCPLKRSLVSGRVETEEMEVETIGGVFLVSCTPVVGQDGRPEEVIHFATDITEKKRAETALRESEKRYRMLMQAIQAAVVVYDGNAKIIASNRMAEKLLGLSTDGMLGRPATDPAWEFLFEDGSVMGEEACLVNQVLATGQRLHDFVVGIRASHKKDTTWVLVNANPLMDNHGKVAEVVVTFMDITDRKREADARDRFSEQLFQTQRTEALATLAGGIAHQFNNALSVITGNIDLLRMDFPDDKDVDRRLRAMSAASHRMSQLTTQLLAYGRGGKYRAQFLSPNELVADTLASLKHALNPTVHIETDLPSDLWHIRADLSQMQMLFSALMANASESVEDEGRIDIRARNAEVSKISARRHPGMKPGRYVCMILKDNGTGMDEATRNRIFEPFFTTKLNGRGLGMAAAYGIVKNHGGYIVVESEEGLGTEVQVYLPAATIETKAVDKPGNQTLQFEGTVLIIEDEEMVMAVMSHMLKRLGCHVLKAATGQEGIQVAKGFGGNIDLVFLDVFLPDMAGNDVYSRLMEVRPDLNVVVCSGSSAEGPAQQILRAGARGFLQKPVLLKTLSQTLQEVLG